MSAACPRCGSTENLDTYGVCDGPCPTGADDLAAQLEARTCPAGLPHTGDDPASDHGHTDCWLMRRAAARLRELEAVEDDRTWLRAELDDLRAERDRLRIERDALLELLGQNADEGWRER